jgi:hypothetical protein
LSRLLSGRSSVVREGRLSGGFSEYWTPLGGPKSARRRVRKRRLSRRKEEGEVATGGGFGLPILLVQSILFRLTDKQPTQRQLCQVVELG